LSSLLSLVVLVPGLVNVCAMVIAAVPTMATMHK
jgi:hypothetical protein